MGFLTPLFLVAGLSIAIPLLLHLWHRPESKSLDFPAIRYLLRTERDHSKRIRARQLLLLLLRIAILAVIVLLGARIHFPGPGGAHEPTALVLIIDNSMSSGLVEDGARRLDRLKEMAGRSVDAAGPDDVIWVIQAGRPWSPSLPGGTAQAEARIEGTEVSDGYGDLSWALGRARTLAHQSEHPNQEIHVFTDLQASAFSMAAPPIARAPADEAGDDQRDTPVVIFALQTTEFENHSIASVLVGGGLPPLAGRRSNVAVELSGGTEGDSVAVRIFIDGQVRAATVGPTGATVQLPIGPFPTGRVEGYAEVDSDALSADDRSYFSFVVRQPTPVGTAGRTTLFLREALGVLESDGRIALTPPASASSIVSMAGEGLDRRGPNQSVMIFPPADPARIPALNRRLTSAGIPATYGRSSIGGARIESNATGVNLDAVQIARFHPIQIGPGTDETLVQTAATLSTGDAWIVTGESEAGPFILFGSPLELEATDLPVSAAMIPLLEWAVERGAGTQRQPIRTAGRFFTPPTQAQSVESPDGTRHMVDGDQPFHETGTAGIYRTLTEDSVLTSVAINPAPEESDLSPLSRGDIGQFFGPEARVVQDPADWTGSIFREGRGPEPWQALLVLVLGLLVVESIVAASEGLRGTASPDTTIDPSHQASRT